VVINLLASAVPVMDLAANFGGTSFDWVSQVCA
jgi:hypothetical protein